jgi:hypothetical protein
LYIVPDSTSAPDHEASAHDVAPASTVVQEVSTSAIDTPIIAPLRQPIEDERSPSEVPTAAPSTAPGPTAQLTIRPTEPSLDDHGDDDADDDSRSGTTRGGDVTRISTTTMAAGSRTASQRADDSAQLRESAGATGVSVPTQGRIPQAGFPHPLQNTFYDVHSYFT